MADFQELGEKIIEHAKSIATEANENLTRKFDEQKNRFLEGEFTEIQLVHAMASRIPGELFSQSTRFTTAVIKTYHEWLMDNYELTPKK